MDFLLLTNLEELGWEPQDFWDEAHADLVISRLITRIPLENIVPLRIGESLSF
jgi:hypothetical protein